MRLRKEYIMDNRLLLDAGTSALQFEIKSLSNRLPKNEAEKILSSYSTKSTYDDQTWVIDKINLDQNITDKLRSIYFGKFKSDVMLSEAKDWAIMLLMKRRDNRSITLLLSSLRKLIESIQSNAISFCEVSAVDILNYYNYLFNTTEFGVKSRLESWFNVQNFFKEMEFESQYLTMKKYILPGFPDKRKVPGKLIPEEIVAQLDFHLKTMDLPHAYRTIYWILRLIPNRIGEVLSMSNKCLKAIDNNTFVLTIPTFKQSGRFATGTLKLIEIKYEGIGKYLIDLVKQQIKSVEDNPEEGNDFLFRSPTYRLFLDDHNRDIKYMEFRKKHSLIRPEGFNKFLRILCEHKEIKNFAGKLVKVTSHQFRHNAISDRLNSGIFRAIDIMSLTKHHNTKMIEQTYTHTTKENLQKDAPIIYRGRIINTSNEKKLNQLLARPYAKRIYKLGICADISNCSRDKSQCLRCEYMIPSFDDLDYYEYELLDWQKKKESALENGNVVFSELCQDWIESYEIIIRKVLGAITNENVVVLEGGLKNDN